MVLIGLLLPMTEALQDRWMMTIYNMASYRRRPAALLGYIHNLTFLKIFRKMSPS